MMCKRFLTANNQQSRKRGGINVNCNSFAGKTISVENILTRIVETNSFKQRRRVTVDYKHSIYPEDNNIMFSYLSCGLKS